MYLLGGWVRCCGFAGDGVRDTIASTTALLYAHRYVG